MLKFILLCLVIGTFTNTILVNCESRGHIQHDDNADAIDKTGRVYAKDAYDGKEEEKFYKKKYYEEKKYSNPEKESYMKKKHESKHKKYKNIEVDYLDDSVNIPENRKYSKYEKRENHFESPSKNKDVFYHDKSNSYKKERISTKKNAELVILEHEKPQSLLHDTDVNYLAPFKDVNGNAEVFKSKADSKSLKKKDYVNNGNGNKRKDIDDYYKNLKEIDLTSIPSVNNSALVARYIIHNVDWTAIATLSVNSKFKGGPFVNVISVSDGPSTKGSGVPFFYMTPKDFSSMDLKKDDRCSITATLAQTNYCKEKNLDPESPLCARLILVGKIKKIKPDTEEENFAKLALFSKHPEMETWPADHNWFFSKLKIKQIILIDHFGGATYVDLQDYFNAESA